ncbi:MAG: single-stranded DNA-binding protein [Gemmataceae bacterium]
MANLNKVILIGRLTRDPETKVFANGGMVAKISFAVTNRKKNSQTGQWEDSPMFIDCEVYNRGESGKQADLVRDRCRKGSQIMIEGRLELDTWDDKTTGQKRSKHKVVIDNVQLLDPRQDGGGMGGGGMGGGGGFGRNNDSGGGMNRGGAPSGGGYSPPQTDDDYDNDDGPGGNSGDGGKEIPF